MKWKMEVEAMESVLEKIWDLHDKLSDAIHSISTAHFLNSLKTKKLNSKLHNDTIQDPPSGFVFVKGSQFHHNATYDALKEAKSLNAIRTALENLEDQLEFFHTVQTQQRAERDVAIARLEQSRVVLAMRLAEHHGKKYKVIEEALALVGDVQDAARFVSPENLYDEPQSPDGENVVKHDGKKFNIMIRVLFSGFEFAKKALKLDHVGGVLGNAALFTVSMIAFVHLHNITCKQSPYQQEDTVYGNRVARRNSQPEMATSSHGLPNLDVTLAKG